MQKTYHAIFPLEKISRRSRRKYKRPWITAAIIKIIKERNRFFKSYLKNKTASNFKLYKKKRAEVKRKINFAKKGYYCRLFDQN